MQFFWLSVTFGGNIYFAGDVRLPSSSLTCVSVSMRLVATSNLLGLLRYLFSLKCFSSSSNCCEVKAVLGLRVLPSNGCCPTANKMQHFIYLPNKQFYLKLKGKYFAFSFSFFSNFFSFVNFIKKDKYFLERSLWPVKNVKYFLERSLWPVKNIKYFLERSLWPVKNIKYFLERFLWPVKKIKYFLKRFLWPVEKIKYFLERSLWPVKKIKYFPDRSMQPVFFSFACSSICFHGFNSPS